MVPEQPVEVRAITKRDTAAVASFLHSHLNSRVSVQSWIRAMQMPWIPDPPNRGFMLTQDNKVVGANLAFYSRRTWANEAVTVCNLGALCVREDQRHHAVRLIRALLRQRGFEFTDFSPSGNVVALNRRLGFTDLDTTTLLIANLPGPASGGAELLTEPSAIEAALRGPDSDHFRSLRDSPALHHLVLSAGDRACYVVLRKDRRKGLPLFATVLYVGDPDLFRCHAQLVFQYALLRMRAPFTLLELRVAQLEPRLSWLLRGHRPKMIKSKRIGPDAIDYLYSELTEVAW